MNVRFLETFIWVARLRSFSSAASKLCTTQAAISNRIATLEKDLGVRLFERDLRSVSLTPAGERALAQAEAIVRMTSELRLGIGDTHRLRGRVAIGTIDTIVYAWLPRLVEAIKEAYPDVDPDLTVDNSLTVARMLLDRQVDLALIAGPLLVPDCRNIELCSYECVWVAAPRLGLHGRSLTLEDVAESGPIFAFSRGSQPHQHVQQIIEEAGLDPQKVRVLNSNSLATITRLVRDGMGVAVLPSVLVQEMRDRGELAILNVQANMPLLNLHAIYREEPGSPLPRLIAHMASEIAAAATREARAASHTD